MNEERAQVGENFSMADELFQSCTLGTQERIALFNKMGRQEVERQRIFYHRVVGSASDTQVMVEDPHTGRTREMLMFGSNNYLGLANDPYIKEYVTRVIAQHGTGIGGAPFLNGYTTLTRTLEERIAAIKKQESAMVFSSGYSANIGLVSGITQKSDIMLYDEYSHASFYDGMLLSRIRFFKFRHSDVEQLELLLQKHGSQGRNVFVGIEGVYSMDGDIAPLDRIIHLCRQYGAMLLVDDAHGTGVLGATGKGIGEHFDLAPQIDVAMGTFSKAIAASGGFVCASREVVDFLRYFSRSYMFSSAMGPSVTGAILGALDVLEREPQRRRALYDNVAYAVERLNGLGRGFSVSPQTAILVIRAPSGMDIRAASREFHENGVFVNTVEYPAVPAHQQRLRISMMATHTKAQIDTMVQVVDRVWDRYEEGAFAHHAAEPASVAA
jgi:8-amino-7-oxononanoate synthase